MKRRMGILRGCIRSLRDERGQGLVEYALVISVVSVGTVSALVFLRDEIKSVFGSAGSSIAAGAGPSTPGSPGGPVAIVSGGSPVITLVAATLPASTTSATSATIRFTSSPLATSYSCVVSGPGGSTQPCTAGNDVTFSGLGVGQHTLTVTPTPAGTNGSHTWQVAVPSAPADGTPCTTCETAGMENVSGAVYYAGSSVQIYVGGSWSTVSGPGVYLPSIVSNISGDTCSFTFANGFTFSGTWSGTANGPGGTPGYRVGSSGSGDFYRRCS